MPPVSIVVLGAGVTGLTTASEFLRRFPTSSITVVGKYLPGDISPTEYCSPQAGANWISFEDDLGQYATYDRVAFERFLRIAEESPESGVKRFPMRLVYDQEPHQLKKKWYEELVGGIREVPGEELPQGAKSGLDLTTFIFNPSVYLMWLQTGLLKAGVKFVRRSYDHINGVFEDFPAATVVFNCTGLGARNLGGVEDKKVYPVKGQTILIAEPKNPVERMYVYTGSKFGNNEFAHVFPRPLGGGIIIGGVRLDDDWDGKPDMDRAERIKQRACQLCPELGSPKKLQTISHNVGLRPTRKGGARVEVESRKDKFLVHNYGAGGAGYQSSWGTAERAVELFAQYSIKSNL